MTIAAAIHAGQACGFITTTVMPETRSADWRSCAAG
jgi:hypothetical protein